MPRSRAFTGYLVLAVCNLDDIPVRFVKTREEALQIAGALEEPTDNPLGTMDLSGFIGAKVLSFRGGVPDGTAEFIDLQKEEQGS